jgi:hypothetical protein
MPVARKAVKPGNCELGPDSLGVTDGCLWLRAGVGLTALHLNVLGHELPTATIEITGHRLPLGFQAKTTAAPLVGGDAQVRDELSSAVIQLALLQITPTLDRFVIRLYFDNNARNGISRIPFCIPRAWKDHGRGRKSRN